MSDTILLVENITAGEGNIISESTKDGKNVYLHGIFMQAETRNRNDRIYPLDEMCNAVSSARKEIEEQGGIFGELDHPKGATINLDRISHIITDLRMEGNNVIGKARLLDTPMGLIGKELLKSGRRVGISSRGGGKLNESGIVSDFTFITADMVATPSARNATPMAIYESLMDDAKGRKVLTLAESVREDEAAQKHLGKALNDFFEALFKGK